MKVPLVDLKTQFRSLQTEMNEAVERVFEKQMFILDEQNAELEKEIAELTGTRFAIGCASGTDALLLSLLALGVGPGDEVITPAYSFFASASMIAWLDATPVFVDIDPLTFNLLRDQVKSKLSPRTKAIVGVDLFGQCCELEEIASHGIPVIEDAAQAIGSFRNNKRAGSMGITGCFSFFPTKNLGGYGDGGMVVTSDESVAKQIRLLGNHGQQAHRYEHGLLGMNSRLDEIQAAILRVKLKHLQRWRDKRAQNAAYYDRHLRDLPVELPAILPENVSNHHQYVIKTEKRDQLKHHLADHEIGTAIYYPIILPLQPCFVQLGYKPGDFPNAERCAETSLALPIHPELSDDQLEWVVRTIVRFFK